MTEYYHLTNNTMDPCSLSTHVSELAKSTWCCTGCNHPKLGTGAIEATIQERPSDPPLNFIYGYGVPVATLDFIEALGRDVVDCDLLLGRLFTEDGKQVKDWVTVRGRHCLIARASKHVSHRKCVECGRNLYFAMGPRYLYPAPPIGYDIFESDLFALIVTKRVFDRLDLERWPGLDVEKLTVVTTPDDSLLELTSIYA